MNKDLQAPPLLGTVGNVLWRLPHRAWPLPSSYCKACKCVSAQGGLFMCGKRFGRTPPPRNC